MNAETVGKYFYNRNNNLSEIQVQKLTYYAYVWSMVINNEKLFEEKPQAWVHGPVFRSLYDAMKSRAFYENKCDFNFERKTTVILEMVFRLYGKFSGNELESMTHSEIPWIKARNGKSSDERSTEELKDEDIKEYYSELLGI